MKRTATMDRPERFAREAHRIALAVASKRLETRFGFTWRDPGRDDDKTVGMSLYRGVAGIASFLAATGRARQDQELIDVALAATLGLCRQLRGLQARKDSETLNLNIGSCVGIASTIYGVVLVARLLERQDFLVAARQAAGLLTRKRIESDRLLDVMSGTAGALHVLLTLEKASPDDLADAPPLLERARWAGSHLLAARRQENGALVWPSSAIGKSLAGYGHGTAGILDALGRLRARSGNGLSTEDLNHGLEAENRWFDSTVGNWRDARHDSQAEGPVYGTRWCHGGPGIAIGRYGLLEHAAQALDEHAEQAQLDLLAGAAVAAREGLDEVDYLCCGNFGRSEILERIGVSGAAEHAEAALDRAEATGGFAGVRRRSGEDDPSLFLGISGIGWTLLGLSGEPLPNVLALR